MHTVVESAVATRSQPASRQPLLQGFDASTASLAEEINATGLACLRGVIADEWLEVARDSVTRSARTATSQEVFIDDLASDPSSFAHPLVNDQRLEPFLRAVASACVPRLKGQPQMRIENELRLVMGPPRSTRSLWFHYDSTAVTLVVPIVIPRAAPGTSGELVLCPNRRPYRRSVAVNILEKCVTQNDFYRRRFVSKLASRKNTRTEVLEPGNAYLFNGYRSYHATLPCPPHSLRATLILHVGEVHGDSRLLGWIQSVYRAVYWWARRHDDSVQMVTAGAGRDNLR
ncbi:hypothetical protein [Mycobacterium sp. NPDC006124]|uniref:hypothetical protein n=1 Tax=Mycobacterium sp. NPDC006124 TaxID=3156729 RepID=UPI0033BE7258